MSDTRVATRPYIIGPAATSFVVPAAGAAYTGPGDLGLGTAKAWWGVRAYSAAAATALSDAVNITRSSDTTSATIKVTSSGPLNTLDAFFDGSSAYRINTMFDQTGAGNNLTRVGGSRPLLTLSGFGTFAVISSSFTSGSIMTTAMSTTAQPFTFSSVARRLLVNTAGFCGSITGGNCVVQWSGADTVQMLAGGSFTATMTDASVHAVQFVFNGAASDLNVDATPTVGNGGTNGLSSDCAFPGNAGFQGAPEAFFMEGGVWTTAFSSGNSATMSANQHTFWGF